MENEMIEQTIRQELAQEIFKLIEDIEHAEDIIKDIKEETQAIKESLKADSGNIDKISSIQYNISLIQEEQLRLAKVVANMSESNDFTLVKDEVIDNSTMSTIIDRIQKLENEIKIFKDSRNIDTFSGDLSSLSDTLTAKSILKKEITRWQSIIIGILVFLAFISFYFFGFVFSKQDSTNGILIYFIAVVPFSIAMYMVNNHIKRLISQEKILPLSKSSNKPTQYNNNSTNPDNPKAT